MRLPSLDSMLGDQPGNAGAAGIFSTVEHYARVFEDAWKSLSSFDIPVPKYMSADELSKALTQTTKSIGAPPSAFAFGRISYMPDTYNRGVLQWPGLAPDALRKVVRENVAPQLIIGMRVDDVLRYSTLSNQPWKPGWQIETMETTESPSAADRKAIQEAESFIQNSNIEYGLSEARERDAHKMMGFQGFLSAAVRDSLTFDGIAVWTDMDLSDRVKGYTLLPAANIRLTNVGGYDGDKDKFAVAVDDGGRVIHSFTRDELTFYVRNRRNDPDALGYGYSEVEIAIRLIKGFQNALDFNVDIFDKSSIPNAIMTISGSSVTQKQLDLLNRMWTNLKKGITKAWSLPVIGLSGTDSKIEIIKLNDVHGMEAYYKDFMNMLAGALCTVYRFPVKRLGYRISGHGHDTQPNPDAGKIVDEDDPGLAPLLIHLECLINEYLIWSRWPNLRFAFNGKSPKEDARKYEAKMNARTWAEQRKDAGLEPLTKLAEPWLKDLAEIMELAPADPGKTSMFQSLAASFLEPEKKDQAAPGAEIQPKKDPARSREHGHESGVRRDSASESK